MNDSPFLFAGYLIFWLILFAYILYLALKMKALDRKVIQIELVINKRK